MNIWFHSINQYFPCLFIWWISSETSHDPNPDICHGIMVKLHGLVIKSLEFPPYIPLNPVKSNYCHHYIYIYVHICIYTTYIPIGWRTRGSFFWEWSQTLALGRKSPWFECGIHLNLVGKCRRQQPTSVENMWQKSCLTCFPPKNDLWSECQLEGADWSCFWEFRC